MLNSPRWLRRLFCVLAAALILALPSLAHAQGSTVYQNGQAIPNHIAKFVTNGRIADTGGLLGDSAGLGLTPFAVTDNNGLAFCANTAATTGPYNALCFGHTSTGDGLISRILWRAGRKGIVYRHQRDKVLGRIGRW